ncbi:inositol monophosphatase family protein [Aliiruegeria lutimaris]|uniref:Fructose-1,6-bisphosphatase n=1 Tax=Aliiruegeria lutimaris TaxID=571298 RepID=A0A1G8K2R7_9RHOB|nr:inositol monophosphatase family protein [Aliiruegeria lutimaris]SDI37731.1 fructose-1,6-bisphosphatase [Aliiruegeria lutimaris]
MIPTVEQENALIEAVRAAAKAEILPRFRNLDAGSIGSKANADDLVTVADRGSEAMIGAAVKEILPEAEVIGEEAVSENPALLDRIVEAETCVIIDPIDGTWNFARGLAIFGVLLAVVEKGETVFGLLYDPVVDDWILARKGGGAWFCTPGGKCERLDITGPQPQTDFAGFGAPWLLPEHMRVRMAGELVEFGRVMDIRCACHVYRMMCFGNGRFSIDLKLMPWDHAAGALALTEAGGKVGLMDGRDYSPTITDGYMLGARNAETHAKMRAKFGWIVE